MVFVDARFILGPFAICTRDFPIAFDFAPPAKGAGAAVIDEAVSWDSVTIRIWG